MNDLLISVSLILVKLGLIVFERAKLSLIPVFDLGGESAGHAALPLLVELHEGHSAGRTILSVVAMLGPGHLEKVHVFVKDIRHLTVSNAHMTGPTHLRGNSRRTRDDDLRLGRASSVGWCE